MTLPRALVPALGVVVALALGIAACGSAAQRDGGEPVATSTVDMPASYRFAPAAISIPVGTTVTWTNSDNFTHSIQFLDGGLPTEPMLVQPSAVTTFTFATAGTYRYQCHLHPQQMQGTVTVTP